MGPESAQVVASAGSSRVALAAADRLVTVWDLDTGRRVRTLDTVQQLGERIALSDDGSVLVCAGYRRGVAAYDVAQGAPLWRRRDLGRPQFVGMGRGVVYVGLARGAVQVLSLRDGATVDRVPGAARVFDSPDGGRSLVDGRALGLRTAGGPLRAVDRRGSHLLCAAFLDGSVVVSEVGGPVRCLDLDTAEPRWQHDPRPGEHVVALARIGRSRSVAAVVWPFAAGGPKRLGVLDDAGRFQTRCELGAPAAEAFAGDGRWLVLSDHRVVDTTSGEQRALGDP